jgi:membrane protease YdiL (CAAX protease family)
MPPVKARIALPASFGLSSGWIPVGLLVLGAIVGPLRLPVLGAIAAASAVVLVRSGRTRPAGPGVAWLAALPLAVSLAVGLLPDPAVADPGACDELFPPPVARRLVQAGAALGVVALLAPRLGGRRSLGLVMPSDRRVVALAAMSPLLAPIGIILGPILAGPFFGEVRLGPIGLAALVPAVLLAVANASLEEVTYRGALQRWGAPALGIGGAIVAQALVFGSAHLGTDVLAGGPLLWLGMMAAGLVAGVVADRTGSLLLVFAVHAAVDVPLALALTCRVA